MTDFNPQNDRLKSTKAWLCSWDSYRDSNKSHNECTYFDLLGYDSHNAIVAIYYEAKARDEITIQLMSNNQTL